MNHFGGRVISLLLAVLFLLAAGGVSFYAVFRGTLVFADSPLQGIEIIEVDGNPNSTVKKLSDSSPLNVKIKVTDNTLSTLSSLSALDTFKFDDNDTTLKITEPITISDFTTTSSTATYIINTKLTLKKKNDGTVKGTLKYPSGTVSDNNRTFVLDFSDWMPQTPTPDDGTNPDIYNLQSYRFYDDDGDIISKLTKGKKIDKLVVTLKDGGFTKETYDAASKREFSASLNYDTFDPKDRDMEPRFSNTATPLSDGCVSYTVTFYDLRYTGDTKELIVKIGYPQEFGLERREFTETLPEGDLYDKSSSSSSSESSSSEVIIDPPTPRLIITDYDYGGANVAAASTATLTMTVKNVSREVPVDNVVLKVTMPEAFTLTDSSNTFYFDRIGREREETISVKFTVKPTAEAISQSIKLSFAYEAVISDKRTPLTSDEEIAIPVNQVNRMTLNPVESPPEVYIGDNSASIESTFVNMGKTAVYNVTVSIEGENLAQPGQAQFIGNVESGIEKTADFVIEGKEAGPITGEIVLTYEDANMKVTELRTKFSTEAVEMDMGPTQDELDAMNQPQDMPTESAAWYVSIPGWYWAVGGLVALILVAYLVKLTRVSRLTLLEDDDEDF